MISPCEYESLWFCEFVMARPPAADIPDWVKLSKGDTFSRDHTHRDKEEYTGHHGGKRCSAEYP